MSLNVVVPRSEGELQSYAKLMLAAGSASVVSWGFRKPYVFWVTPHKFGVVVVDMLALTITGHDNITYQMDVDDAWWLHSMALNASGWMDAHKRFPGAFKTDEVYGRVYEVDGIKLYEYPQF